MATRRLKTSGFETRSEFEQALNDIASMSVDIRKIEADRDMEVQEVIEGYNDDIQAVQKLVKGQLALAEKYALAHRKELLPEDKKSGETSLARFGFRMGLPTLATLNRKWTWETVINALRSQSLEQFIVTKHTPDKDAMKAHLDKEKLAAVGCRIKQAESFWVEAKLDEKERIA